MQRAEGATWAGDVPVGRAETPELSRVHRPQTSPSSAKHEDYAHQLENEVQLGVHPDPLLFFPLTVGSGTI